MSERQSRRLVRAAMVGVAIWVAGGLGPHGASVAGAEVTMTNSADTLIIWTGCAQFPDLTDAELDTWKTRGVDGIACIQRHLRQMGGTQDFTGAPNASLAGTNYDFQRRLRDRNIVGRMRARGMKAYLGFYLVNYWNLSTPLVDWFDDRGWSQLALRKLADGAAAARLLGFAGLAFDQELYAQKGGVMRASWNWNYPDNSHSEPDVRSKARQRGREVMSALVASFPGIELLAYHVRLPETWDELVQDKINGLKAAMAPRLDIDFLDGLSSVQGYSAIRLLDATFYKTFHLSGASWETAFQYNYNKLYSYFSRRLSNWDYASSRLFVSPFSWIDNGPCGCAFEAARPPEYVAAQLAAFRTWGMGGEFANYAYRGPRGFDYGPYVSGMQAASTPAVVDSAPPGLAVDRPPAGPRAPVASLALTGTATDNLAIRFVRWRNDRTGGSGTARLTWDVLSGDYRSGYRWRTRWSVGAIPLAVGMNHIAIITEDIKGLATTRVITFANGSATAASSTSASSSM